MFDNGIAFGSFIAVFKSIPIFVKTTILIQDIQNEFRRSVNKIDQKGFSQYKNARFTFIIKLLTVNNRFDFRR